MDHRHNFSAYFYPIYLQMFDEGTSTVKAAGVISTLSKIMDKIARHPLSSFFPQFSLAIGSGFLLPAASVSITFTWFIQTLVFVTFNKVCTSQVNQRFALSRQRTFPDSSCPAVLYLVFVFPTHRHPATGLESHKRRSMSCHLGIQPGKSFTSAHCREKPPLIVLVHIQALWLSIAYRLEFLAQNVFLPLWAASLVFLGANTWCICVLLDSYRIEARTKVE